MDELALEILRGLVASNEWNEYNYLNSASQDPRYQRNDAALRALAEGLGWLRSRGLIARTPGQTADAAIFVTRAGHQALKDGIDLVRAEGDCTKDFTRCWNAAAGDSSCSGGLRRHEDGGGQGS